MSLAEANVARTLDELEITDIVFHDLQYTLPLAAELFEMVRARPRQDRILLVGPNVALAQALVDDGRRVEIWHVSGVALTEDLRQHATRAGTIDDLFDEWPEHALFDVVILPYVLDAARRDPDEVLSVFYDVVAPTGVLLVVSHRAGALSNRVRAAAGHALIQQPSEAEVRHSWSWPLAPPRRLLDEPALRRAANRAGFRVERDARVLDTLACPSVEAIPLSRWIGIKVRRAAKRIVPALRDTAISALRPMVPNRPRPAHAMIDTLPPVTVYVVAGADDGTPQPVVGDLEGQTYPRELIDIRVCEETAMSANANFLSGEGHIVAFTVADCRLPAAWVESGVRAMGSFTAAVAGALHAEDGSAVPFLALPGQGLRSGGNGLFLVGNSFYRREALVAVGGFDEAAGSAWGWDSTAAARLRAAGYPTTDDDTAIVFRQFDYPRDRSWVRAEFERAREIPAAVRRDPQLRVRPLYRRYFASERTFSFDVMLAGCAIAVARRKPAYAVVFAVPWIRSVSEYLDFWPPSEWRATTRVLRGILVRNACWLAGLATGSLRARRVVL